MTVNVNQKHQESLNFQDRLALKITSGVGTMLCCYFFALLALTSLPAVVATHNVVTTVSWITQTFLQLVLLPLIMVSQNLQTRHSEMRAEADFRTNVQAEQEIKDIQDKLNLLLASLSVKKN